LAHRSCKGEGAFSCYYQHSVSIIHWQEEIRLVVQQVALLTYGFQVRVILFIIWPKNHVKWKVHFPAIISTVFLSYTGKNRLY